MPSSWQLAEGVNHGRGHVVGDVAEGRRPSTAIDRSIVGWMFECVTSVGTVARRRVTRLPSGIRLRLDVASLAPVMGMFEQRRPRAT